ncbi:hypothetical protein [Burkholderia gladioli]|uniref:hypothetical protein n=1 Tax=Burkholderia gladioli TaxID=28095 RepID=UPI002FE39CB3
MKKAILATAFLLAGCASADQPMHHATKAESDTATKAYLDCATQQIATLDDGISDARTIAAGAAAACTAEYRAMSATDASRRPTQREARYYMEIAMSDPHRPDELIPLVLAARKRAARR